MKNKSCPQASGQKSFSMIQDGSSIMPHLISIDCDQSVIVFTVWITSALALLVVLAKIPISTIEAEQI